MTLQVTSELTFNVIKVLSLAALGAGGAVLWTPVLTHFLYKYKLWKKNARKRSITGEKAPVFYRLHRERETRAPRMGGLLIWVTALVIIFLIYGASQISNNPLIQKLNFLSRKETWLPLFTLVAASMVGLFDDILQIKNKGKYIGGGLSFKGRLLIITFIGMVGAWWFFYKLGWDILHIPLLGDFSIGFWYIPLFMVVMIACWSGGIIDGIDGLSGGVFASIFGAFSLIAFSQGKVDLASFCGLVAGGLLAFLWFNIPPARFYMGETGILGLTSTMAVVAFLTNSVVVLPIIGGLMVVEVGSVILQLCSKRIRGKKIWLSTPIHHHLEAKGWPPYKVTMRFWIIGVVLAIIGVALRLLG